MRAREEFSFVTFAKKLSNSFKPRIQESVENMMLNGNENILFAHSNM